jgi:hypothetical protein
MPDHRPLIITAFGLQQFRHLASHLWVGKVVSPPRPPVVWQVHQCHTRRIAQAFGDGCPVLSLAEQAVKEDHPWPGGSQLSAEEPMVSRVSRHGRRCQQLMCQCRRSSTPDPDSKPGVSGHATTCGVPGAISTLQAGHR